MGTESRLGRWFHRHSIEDIEEINKGAGLSAELGVKAQEIAKLESAIKLEKLATGAFLRGQITSRDYQLLNELTFPITKIDLRKLAQDVRRMRQMSHDS